MYYKRKYEKDILRLLQLFPAIGIIGPRQAGKTTLVKNILPAIDKESIYLDMERNSDYNKLSDPELFLTQHIGKCVVIDEVQRKPELFPLLRSLIDENKINGQYILLGSASPDLLRQSSESLAGRIAYIEVMPFDLEELPSHISMESNWFMGGFPRAIFSNTNEDSKTWIDNFIKTYTERDLQLLGLNNSPVFLHRFWTMLSHYAGRIINYTDIANSMDISLKTVKRYIDFYEKAYLVQIIYPFYKNISKRLVKSPKLIFCDTGILHRFLGLESMENLYGHPMLGNSWENYCILQIINVIRGKYDVSFFRTHDGAETDLILSKSIEPEYAIEIKYTSTPSLSKASSMAFKSVNAKQNYIITPRTDEYKLKPDITTCNLKTFLTKYLYEK